MFKKSGKIPNFFLIYKKNYELQNKLKIQNKKKNELKIKNGFPVIEDNGGMMMKDSKFRMEKINNEFDKKVTYNLKPGFKESFGFGVSFKRK